MNVDWSEAIGGSWSSLVAHRLFIPPQAGPAHDATIAEPGHLDEPIPGDPTPDRPPAPLQYLTPDPGGSIPGPTEPDPTMPPPLAV